MLIIRAILLAFEVIVCILLTCIVLIQKSKGGGLGVAFGGGGGSDLFGSRTGNVLTRATIILAAAFLINTVVLAMLSGNTVAQKSILEKAIDSGAVQSGQPAAQAPAAQAPMMPDASTGVTTLPGSSFDANSMTPVEAEVPAEPAATSEEPSTP